MARPSRPWSALDDDERGNSVRMRCSVCQDHGRMYGCTSCGRFTQYADLSRTKPTDDLQKACETSAHTVAELLRNLGPHLPDAPGSMSRSSPGRLSFVVEVSHAKLASLSAIIKAALDAVYAQLDMDKAVEAMERVG